MKKWTVDIPDKAAVSKLTFGCGVTTLAAAVLARRGFTSPEDAAESLNVSELSDPFLIKDMQEAADTVNEAINSEERICIYGDYDCDGIMSTVILYTYLSESGADVTYYIPERSEGYGLNMDAIDRLHDEGVQLIITVDNGIAAIAEAEHIYELGMRLVVTDHHQAGEVLPKAEAVVDPHRPDCFSPFKSMCGAGVALKLIAALDGGDYTMALEQFGDLAAIATVADVVSITGENRFLTAYGMELINNTDRPALMALKEVSGYTEKDVDSFGIGFGLAPRINASGRFGSPRTAAELFLTEDYDQALDIARELDQLNIKRKNAESEILGEIYSMIDADPSLVRGRCIVINGRNWHHGVIGIVAARIEEQFGKPAFIASENDGELRGSARSFGEFSIFGALCAASEALDKFGGHPGAGGFTVKPGMADRFRELIEQYAFENNRMMPVLTITADAPVSPMEIVPQNVEGLSILEPFGTDNEKPLFYMENAVINDVIPLSGGAHSKLSIKYGFGNFEVLVFRTPPSSLICGKGDVCDMIVTLGINNFRNTESVSIIAEDIRPHGFQQGKYFAGTAAFESFLRGEELPPNYYPSMLPSRDDVVRIYKAIPDSGIKSDTIYLRLSDQRLNYCRFSVSLEALRQLGLINITSADSLVTRVRVNKKSDLDSAPILAELRRKIGILRNAKGTSTVPAGPSAR